METQQQKRSSLTTNNTLPKMSKPSTQDRHRHSLQPQINLTPLGPLRHTKSHNFERSGAKKKTLIISTIHEVEDEASVASGGEVEIVNEKKKEKRSSIRKASGGYDNAGFEGSTGNLTRSQQQFRRNSAQGSFISTTSSVRDPSIKSLPYVFFF